MAAVYTQKTAALRHRLWVQTVVAQDQLLSCGVRHLVPARKSCGRKHLPNCPVGEEKAPTVVATTKIHTQPPPRVKPRDHPYALSHRWTVLEK